MYATGLAGMAMSAQALPQCQDTFEHVNRVVLINSSLGFSDEVLCEHSTKVVLLQELLESCLKIWPA